MSSPSSPVVARRASRSVRSRLLWWWGLTEHVNALLWPLAVAAMLISVLPGCDRTEGYNIYRADPPFDFDDPFEDGEGVRGLEDIPDESERILAPIIVDDKSGQIQQPEQPEHMNDNNAFTDHMPSGVEVAPPRGWVEFCVRNPDEPGCTE